MTLFHCPYCAGNIDYMPELSNTRKKPLQERMYVLLCDGLSDLKPHPPIVVIMTVLAVYEDRATKEQQLRQVDIQIFQFKPRFQDIIRYYKRAKNEKNHGVIAGISARSAGENKRKPDDPYIAPFKCLVCWRKAVPNYKLSEMKDKDPAKWTLAKDCSAVIYHKFPITYYVKRTLIDERTSTYDLPEGFNGDLMVAVLFEKLQEWENRMSAKYDPDFKAERAALAADLLDKSRRVI